MNEIRCEITCYDENGNVLPDYLYSLDNEEFYTIYPYDCEDEDRNILLEYGVHDVRWYDEFNSAFLEISKNHNLVLFVLEYEAYENSPPERIYIKNGKQCSHYMIWPEFNESMLY